MTQPVDPGDLLQKIDPICERFERGLEGNGANERPSLESFLEGAHGMFRAALFEELFALELYHRSKANEVPTAAHYIARFPDFEAEIQRAFALASSPPDSSARLVAALAPGSRFGHYSIQGEVGRGGMGIVYEARHDALERTVALKVLPEDVHGRPQAKARFAREARAIARLHHSNIVPIFEFGVERGMHFFAMQFIDGQSLADRIRNRRESKQSLDDREIRQLCRQIEDMARALQFAHESGIVHRDVKPSNVLLDAHQKAWLVDFGVARLDESNLTTDEDLLGTIRYMPPERFSGMGGTEGDVYSLGVTLYEAVSLQPAFGGTTAAELMRNVIETDLPPLRQLVQGVSLDLETVVACATHRDPSRRYRTAEAFADDLDRFQRGEPVLARRQGTLERIGRWMGRNRGPTVVMGLLAVLAIGAFLAASKFSRKNQAITRLRHDVEGLLAESEIARESLRSELYRADMVHCASEATRSQGASLTTILNRWLPGSEPSDRRGWEWYVLRSMMGWDSDCSWYRNSSSKCVDTCDLTGQVAVGGRSGVTIVDGSTRELVMQIMQFSHPRSIEFDPSGERVLVTDLKGVAVHSIHDGSQLAFRPSDAYFPAQWLPDGKRVLMMDPGPTLWDIDSDTSEPVVGTRPTDSSVHASRDGTRLAIPSSSGIIRVTDLETGAMIREIDTAAGGHRSDVRLVKLSPDGRKLVILTRHDGIRFFSTDDGAEIATCSQPHRSTILMIRWSGDGRWVATASTDSTVKVWEADTGGLVRDFRGHQGNVREACFANGSRTLVSTSERGDLRFWNIDFAPGHTYWATGLTRNAGNWVEWAEDQERLLLHGEASLIEWDVTGRRVRKVRETKDEQRFPSPDGKRCLIVTSDRLSLVEVATGMDILDGRFDISEELPRAREHGRWARWSRNGERLYFSGFKHAWIFDELGNGVRVRPMLEGGQHVLNFDLSPDGTELVVARFEGLFVHDAVTARELRRIDLPDRGDIDLHIARPAFNRTGTRLAITHRSRLIIVDTKNYSVVAHFEGDADEYHVSRWSPDGERIATTTREGTVMVFDPEDGPVVSFQCPAKALDLSWDATGRRLAAVDAEGGCHLWNATTAMDHEE